MSAKIQWNSMETLPPRKEGDKVMILIEFGWPLKNILVPVVAEWGFYPVYSEGGKFNIPLGYWRILPSGWISDIREHKELGWLPLENFLP